ncbi:MAG: hypothetical protein PHI68_04345 [Candidatus Cloacimonetes bacterium]|nr:hypothetical protein [Candidatus Cloacimonadota bacterium]
MQKAFAFSVGEELVAAYSEDYIIRGDRHIVFVYSAGGDGNWHEIWSTGVFCMGCDSFTIDLVYVPEARA